jgi:hypothetical protein
MMAAVGLHQLAQTFTAIPPLTMLIPLAMTLPETFGTQPTPQCLMVNRKPQRQQLLARHGRTKTHELTTVCRQHRSSHLDALGTVRSTTTLPMDHAKIALQLNPTLKTPNLTDA